MLLGYLHRAPLATLDLISAFPHASGGPVWAPVLPLGSCESNPFIGEGWLVAGPWPHRETDPVHASAARLRFYLSQPIAVELSLEGRLSPNAGVTQFEAEVVIAQPTRRRWRAMLPLTPSWTRYPLQIPGKRLTAGSNLLQIVCEQPTQWRRFEVQAAKGGLTLERARPTTRVSAEELRLPFGQSLAYPLQLTASSRLSFEDIEPWVQPGASAPAQEGQLQVGLRSGAALVDTSFQLNPGQRSLYLQSEAHGTMELSLLAVAPKKVRPGHLGLRLRRPQVESWEPQPTSETPVLAPVAPAVTTHPNVVLYLIDTLRADHLGCYGYAGETSPHIDGFRKDAVLFADCIAQASWTKPATASILSSLLPSQHGAIDYPDKLHPEVVFLSQVLQQGGYETRAVVTNPFANEPFGFNRGYDRFQYLKRAESEEVNRVALPWLKSRTETRPFFLYLHTLDPHTPYGRKYSDKRCLAIQEDSIRRENDEGWRNEDDKKLKAEVKAAMRAYDREIVANDASFGALLQTLKETGQYDNTLVVLVSDHGEEFLEHGRMGHNNSLYRELLHVPLIIKFPGSRGAGSRILPCWQQIDIAPTILACTGLEAPASMVGKAYRPGGPPGDRERPAYISLKSSRTVQPKHKFPRMIDMTGVRLGNWVLTQTTMNADGRLEPWEMYNLAEDPGESDNKVWVYPEVRVRLNELLLQGARQTTASAQSGKEDVDNALRTLHYLR